MVSERWGRGPLLLGAPAFGLLHGERRLKDNALVTGRVEQTARQSISLSELLFAPGFSLLYAAFCCHDAVGMSRGRAPFFFPEILALARPVLSGVRGVTWALQAGLGFALASAAPAYLVAFFAN